VDTSWHTWMASAAHRLLITGLSNTDYRRNVTSCNLRSAWHLCLVWRASNLERCRPTPHWNFFNSSDITLHEGIFYILCYEKYARFRKNICYTAWSKSHATHSWHMFYLSKNKLHWNQERKNNVILGVENVHRVQRSIHSLFFLMFHATR
jgi:hypothetical protein